MYRKKERKKESKGNRYVIQLVNAIDMTGWVAGDDDDDDGGAAFGVVDWWTDRGAGRFGTGAVQSDGWKLQLGTVGLCEGFID